MCSVRQGSSSPVFVAGVCCRGIQPEALMGALAECNRSVFQGDAFDLHTALECLNNTNLTTVIDSLAPLKVVRPTKGFDPWMDASLISLRRKRKKFKKSFFC